MVLTLTEKENLVENVWAFRFTPSESLHMTAGQYLHVKLAHDNPDEEGDERWFTNSAAPYEEIVQITTRITESTFKRALSQLEPGSTALQSLDAPDGDFVWEQSELPVVFIAGGIGITPFRSVLKQRAHDQLPLSATLVYGGRTPELPFRAELDQWSAADSGLQVRYVIGTRITADALAGILPGLNKSLVYVSGPEPMVESLGTDLKAHGLPEAQLKQDFFPNYTEANY